MPIEEFERFLGGFCDDVVRRARQNGFDQSGKLWSLGEIGLIDTPPKDFLNALATLDAEVVRAAERALLGVKSEESWRGELLGGARVRRCLGLLLLLDIAVIAREEARDGTMWPHVIDAMEAQAWRRQGAVNALFDRDPVRAPNPLLKELISEAAEFFGLRNALELRDLKRWYQTIHLQHGFSVRQFEANCQDWMRSSGVRTATVDLLLGNTSVNGRTITSESFSRLWGYFRHFRRGSLKRSVVEREAACCGWLSSGAVKVCLDQLEKVGVFDLEVDDAVGNVAGRSNPFLDWQQNQDPSWACRVHLPDLLDLPDDEYTLFVEAKKCGRVLRVDAGTRTEHWRGAEVANTDGLRAVGTWLRTPPECSPWCEPSYFTADTNDPMGFFPLTPAQLDSSTEPMLLFRSLEFAWLWEPLAQSDDHQLCVLALPDRYRDAEPNWGIRRQYSPADQTGWRLLQLNVNDESPLELTLNGELVWRYERQVQNNQEVDIRLERLPARVGPENSLRLRAASDGQIRLDSASVRGVALAIDPRRNELTLPIDRFGDDCLSLPIRLKWVVDGQEKCAIRTVRYPYPCIWIGPPNGGHRLLPESPLILTRSGTFRVAGPIFGDAQHATPFVFEGSLPVQSARALLRTTGASRLGSYCCSGLPLTLRGDLFNAGAGLGGLQATQLASCVLNVGVFNGIKPTIVESEGNRWIRVELSWEQLEPDESWRLEILKDDGGVLCFAVDRPPNELEIRSLINGEHPTFNIDDMVACRLVAGGRAHGWWRASAPADKLIVESDQLFEIVLGWDLSLRDSSHATHTLRTVFSADPGSLLKPVDRRPLLLVNRNWRPIDDIHDDAIRWITDDFRPDPDSAGRVCDAIGAHVLQLPANAPTPLWDQIEQATRLSPQLAARLLIALDREPALGRRDIAQRRNDIIAFLRAGKNFDDALTFAVEDDNPINPGFAFAPIKRISTKWGGRGVDLGFVRAELRTARAQLQEVQGNNGALAHIDALCDVDRKSGRVSLLATSYFLEGR